MRDMREELVFFRRKWVSSIRAAAEHHGMQEELFQRPIVREVTCGPRGFAGFAAESPISYANSHVLITIREMTQHVMIEMTQCGTCGKNLFSFGGSG